MVNPAPRPARPHRAPTLKLWVTTVSLRHEQAAELLRVGLVVEVAVYVTAHLKGHAVELLHERLGAIEETGRGVEAVLPTAAPEVAQAMRRDDPASMTTEGRLYVVHGRRVVSLDEDGRAALAGTYAHRARRYHPLTPADLLQGDIDVVDAIANRARGISEADQAALWRVLEVARDRQHVMRAAEEDGGRFSAYEACLDDAADISGA